jgi:hypothetical protein
MLLRHHERYGCGVLDLIIWLGIQLLLEPFGSLALIRHYNRGPVFGSNIVDLCQFSVRIPPRLTNN